MYCKMFRPRQMRRGPTITSMVPLGRRINAQPVEISAVHTDNRSWYGSGWNNSFNQRSQAFQNVSVVADSSAASAPLDGSVAFGRISVTARVSAKFAIE